MPTNIEWADETWNPVTGCTPISTGCANCYAARMSKRLAGRFGYPADDPFRVTLHPDRLGEPLRWRKPRYVFVASMGDLFHEDVPFEYIKLVFSAMAEARRHTFMVLTKRPKRALNLWGAGIPWPTNIWAGVTAENQKRANERVPVLTEIPTRVQFVSIEPMLGPVELPTGWGVPGVGVDWVICGAETGPGARPMEESWALRLRDQCSEAGVPFFFKRNSDGGRMLDGQIYEQWPKEAS